MKLITEYTESDVEMIVEEKDGKKKKWLPWVTMITPPVSVHSHHNESDKMAKFLIVQDAGIYTYTRAMGFEFVDK